MNTRRKKVLFTITKSNWGGAQRYVYDLATSLPKDEFDVVVALGGNGVLKERLKQTDIRVIPIHSWQRDIAFMRDFKSFFEILRVIRSEKPYVVHANSSKAGGITALSARMTQVPIIIFTAHGWPFNDPVGFLNRCVRWFFSWATSLLSHYTIVVSEHNYKQGRRMPFTKRKMRMIHNGIQRAPFIDRTSSRQALIEKLLLQGQSGIFLVGSVGEMNKNKNLGSVVRAIARARNQQPKIDFRLCIIGDGEERPALTDLIRKLSLQDIVYMIGGVPAAEYLPGFDTLVMPSKKEGLPYVILEAGSAELPVIATKVGGIPEIIKDGEEGILVPPDADQMIADSLCALAQDTGKRTRLGQNLSEKISREFSIEKMLTKTQSLYRKD